MSAFGGAILSRYFKKSTLQWISFLLVLLAFPVITYGVLQNRIIAAIGMAMVVIGFLIPPAARYLIEDERKEEHEEER